MRQSVSPAQAKTEDKPTVLLHVRLEAIVVIEALRRDVPVRFELRVDECSGMSSVVFTVAHGAGCRKR